ncbi:MAG: LptF/LptG family permease [Cyanobacteria bacterium P01_F01_bin.143]
MKPPAIKLSILDRYLLTQLIIFFVFSVSLFASVGVTIGTISELTYKINEHNLPINIAILVFILKIPEYIAYALPIGTLLTTLLVYGRLNSDRELIAFRSAGISLYRIIAPAIAFSILITGITLFFSELVVPAANYQTTLLQTPFLGETEFTLQRQDIFYPEYQNTNVKNKQLKRLYYAEKFDGQQLINMTIMTWSEDKLNQIITAKYAQWDQDQKLWQLREGQQENLSDSLSSTAVKQFDFQEISLPETFFELVKVQRSPEEMSLRQAITYLNLILQTGSLKNIQLLQVRIQQKMAFPSICLVFALVGATLGSARSTINKSQGFGLCVAIVFSYYLLGFLTSSLGVIGLISPFIAAWLPNFLGLGISGYLLKSINN